MSLQWEKAQKVIVKRRYRKKLPIQLGHQRDRSK